VSIDAKQITKLLETRHSKDIFIPECKNGSSLYGGGHRRLDAWAMKRAWANPCYYGYEIKVSRSDFLQDDKWREYLPLCNEFSFVAPKGIIQPEELPDGIGLIIVASTGTRLFTKRKAAHREIEEPVDLLLYALMRASDFTRDPSAEKRAKNAEFWRDWLENKRDLEDLGHQVSKRIRTQICVDIKTTSNENARLKKEIEKYKDLENKLEEMGLSIYQWNIADKVKSAMDNGLDDIIRAARGLRKDIDQFERVSHRTLERASFTADGRQVEA